MDSSLCRRSPAVERPARKRKTRAWRGFRGSWLDLLLVACPVARPRIARTIIRTAIIAVGSVAGGGTEAGHGCKLADGRDISS